MLSFRRYKKYVKQIFPPWERDCEYLTREKSKEDRKKLKSKRQMQKKYNEL